MEQIVYQIIVRVKTIRYNLHIDNYVFFVCSFGAKIVSLECDKFYS